MARTCPECSLVWSDGTATCSCGEPLVDPGGDDGVE